MKVVKSASSSPFLRCRAVCMMLITRDGRPIMKIRAKRNGERQQFSLSFLTGVYINIHSVLRSSL
jgi:hypothetical protein